MDIKDLKYLHELYNERQDIQYKMLVLSEGHNFTITCNADRYIEYDDKKEKYVLGNLLMDARDNTRCIDIDQQDIVALIRYYKELLEYIDKKIENFTLGIKDED